MTIKNKINITFGIFFLASVLLVVFAIYPLFKGILRNADDLVATKGNIASLSAEINNFDSLNKQYQSYKPNLDKINNLFINANVPIDFIRFLENLAASSSLSATISPGQSVGGSGQQQWKAVNFSVSAQGSYVNFSRFLERLENAPYLIGIQNLSINSQNDKSGEISANMNIKVFAK